MYDLVQVETSLSCVCIALNFQECVPLIVKKFSLSAAHSANYVAAHVPVDNTELTATSARTLHHYARAVITSIFNRVPRRDAPS